MCSGGESISFSKLTSISKLSNIVNYGNGQTTCRPMRREPDMRNETNPGADVDICHELSPDDYNTVSSYIYNLSPEVFDFRRWYSFNFLFAPVNINSFRHKYPFVHDMLIKQSVDLLAISESKLDHSFTDYQFQVTDYAIYSCPDKYNTVKDICDVYGLTNLIKTPTCHKGPVSTLINVILVSNPKRYIDTLNANFGLSDHHNIIGAATRRFAPSLKPHRIYYRSYKHFCEEKYLQDINCAPFHVADIFDDIDDMTWFHSSLIRTIIDENAPKKSKIVKKKMCALHEFQIKESSIC